MLVRRAALIATAQAKDCKAGLKATYYSDQLRIADNNDSNFTSDNKPLTDLQQHSHLLNV